ncbi:HIT family protein [Metabacillus sediminilitoris]|uniref:Diadenosine tetraphosphate hydrolase n=1 Tax=Metabacillus sediminilitoris TaxID=2567941 RepID=A0A4S4C1L1_9BACI|nr:HIT domain-containing protein [Metabacillus sediminilitoris]QGQ48162.1 diadenosine tetraphosphate hydrolase [Metabacillus sediminilitoris]THF81475.1 diadenosine tetraphosphate hydrolase [Metabacillus sediminilitoris]
MQCPICEKNNQHHHLEIYRNQHIVVSHAPLDANILGYIYIEPLDHYENWSDIPLEVLNDVQTIMKKIDLFLRNEQLAERVYSVTISEMVRHIHYHIIPRHKDMKVKGVSLIEKATQQIANENDIELTIDQVDQFIEKAQKSINI